jgi:hypothetical protein
MEVAELAPDMILIRRYVHATLVLKLHSTAQHSTAHHMDGDDGERLYANMI